LARTQAHGDRGGEVAAGAATAAGVGAGRTFFQDFSIGHGPRRQARAVDALPSAGRSDFEQLGFLDLQQLVDLGDVLLRDVVELLLGPPDLVLARVAVLHHLVERLLGGAPDVADGDLGVLALAPGDLDVLAAG